MKTVIPSQWRIFPQTHHRRGFSQCWTHAKTAVQGGAFWRIRDLFDVRRGVISCNSRAQRGLPNGRRSPQVDDRVCVSIHIGKAREKRGSDEMRFQRGATLALSENPRPSANRYKRPLELAGFFSLARATMEFVNSVKMPLDNTSPYPPHIPARRFHRRDERFIDHRGSTFFNCRDQGCAMIGLYFLSRGIMRNDTQ